MCRADRLLLYAACRQYFERNESQKNSGSYRRNVFSGGAVQQKRRSSRDSISLDAARTVGVQIPLCSGKEETWNRRPRSVCASRKIIPKDFPDSGEMSDPGKTESVYAAPLSPAGSIHQASMETGQTIKEMTRRSSV